MNVVIEVAKFIPLNWVSIHIYIRFPNMSHPMINIFELESIHPYIYSKLLKVLATPSLNSIFQCSISPKTLSFSIVYFLAKYLQ